MAHTLVKDLNIVILRVDDAQALETARAFYGETLGMAVEGEGPAFFSVAPVEGQGASLGVGVGDPTTAGATGAEVWWRVDDADAFHAALVSKGVRIVAEPADRPFGRALSFADPAGNILYAFQEPR